MSDSGSEPVLPSAGELVPAMLLDLRGWQRQSVGQAASLLDAHLSAAPAWMRQGDGRVVALLDLDPAWVGSEACGILLHWLRGLPRHVCLNTALGDAALAILGLRHAATRLCRPSLDEQAWTSQPLAPAAKFRPRSDQRLAFVGPLPPERSGISDYDLALLPELAAHFPIDVVVPDPRGVELPPGATSLISAAEFHQRGSDYAHVLYQIGNSIAHLEALTLLERHPGAVVLHDFYLSHGVCGPEADHWLGERSAHRLYWAHGYAAWFDWEQSLRAGHDHYRWSYPCNRAPLQGATGLIVHSQEALRLASQHYGPETLAHWRVIPHLKRLAPPADREAHRQRLDLTAEAFVVCSFGFLGRSKLSPLILEAFLASELAANPQAVLVFAGSVSADRELEAELQALLGRARAAGSLAAEVRITGWIDADTYQSYLAAADGAVQLRAGSRGESSGTVLDCLAAGLPLIFNAHGSLRELPADSGLRLSEACTTVELQRALEQLYRDGPLRRRMAARGQALVADQHRPERCAELYAEAIRAAGQERQLQLTIVNQLRMEPAVATGAIDPEQAANMLTWLLPPEPSQRQLLLDVTALAQEDLGSGIQRVVRAIAEQLLHRPPLGFRVEPVRACPDGVGYRYAHGFTAQLLGLREPPPEERLILARPGDVFLGIDLHHEGVLRQRAYFQQLRAQGVAVWFVVHDLLPCQLPACFPPGAAELHQAWLEVVAETDGALGVSRSVAEAMRGWLQQHAPAALGRGFAVGWFHHGCDFHASRPSTPSAIPPPLSLPLAAGPTLLMVGTIEPRKGYGVVVEAASLLWEQGLAFNLVIVGREGWTSLPRGQRRDIPSTVARIRRHPQLGQRLFWLDDASDGVLAQLYGRADGLIAASYGEGFGIPLIEAAAYGLPLLVRDLPVFQEVTAGGACFFAADADPSQLAEALRDFLTDLAEPKRAAALPPPDLQPQTWQASADQLVRALGLEPRQQPITLEEASDRPGFMPQRVSRRRRVLRRLKRLVLGLLPARRLDLAASQPVGLIAEADGSYRALYLGEARL